MIAYLLQGANVGSAERDERMRRLSSAGPWQYQPHANGALATWKTGDGPRLLANFKKSRETTDGMLYYPPKELPPLKSLARNNVLQREDAHRVRVETDAGLLEVRVVPAYMSPRRILDDGKLGDFSTQYGKMVRLLLERLNANRNLRFSDVCEDMHACVIKALEYSYRVTRELISDYGIVTEDSIHEFWEGCIHVPKDTGG
jgi:hypothetical protein